MRERKDIKQKKSRNKTFTTAKKISGFILLAIIVGSLALCLSCIGKELPFPFQQDKTIVNPTLAVVNSACTDITKPDTVPDSFKHCTFAMVDNGGKKLNILTKDWTLFAENSISGTDFAVDKISSVALYGNDVYVSTVSLSTDKSVIEQENIVRANIYGECQEVICQLNNKELETPDIKNNYSDMFSKTNRIHDVKIFDNKLTFCELYPNQVNVKQIPVEMNTAHVSKEIEVISTYLVESVLFAACYQPQSRSIILLDWRNQIISCSDNSSEQVATTDGYTTAINRAPNDDVLILRYGYNPVQVIRNGQSQNPDDATTIINFTDNHDLNWGEVLLDGNGTVIVVGRQIPINWFYGLKVNARWLALCVLAACFIFALCYLIRSQIRLARRGLFHEITVAVLIGVTCLVVCVFYSVYMYNATIQQTKTKITEQANIAYSTLSDETKNSFSEIVKYVYASEEDVVDTDINSAMSKSVDINNVSQAITDEFSKDSNIYLFTYYLRDTETGEFFCIADSEKAFHSGYDIDSAVRSEGENTTLNNLLTDCINNNTLGPDTTIEFEGEDISGHYFCSMKFVFNSSNEISGVVAFRAYYDTTVAPIMDTIFKIGFVILFCYLLFLTGYLEIRRMSISIRSYKRERKPRGSTKSKQSFVNLIRPFSFVIALSFGADSALAVLVSKKLFDSSELFANVSSWGFQDFMYGLPITLTCIGLVLGILLFTNLEKRFRIKRIFIVSSVAFSASFFLSMYACLCSNFLMFTFAKFLIGFSCGCMKAELYTFTTIKEDEDERKNLLRDIGRSAMPAVVISTLLCGYFVKFVDYYVLYLFGAICSLFVIVLAILFIPRRAKFSYDDSCILLTRNSSFCSTKKIVRWIFSRQVLLVIFFVIVPFAITKGYKSYMFPLYSSGVGLDKTTISIIYSMATMLSFLLVYVISDFNNRFTDSRKAINALFILGFVFVLFRANSRVEWAVVAMFLTTIFGRTFGSAFRLGLTRICEKDGLNKSQIQPYIYLIEEVCNALQVVLCGIMTTLGGKYACAIFGVYCLISAIIFAIFVGRTAFDNKAAIASGEQMP